MKAGGEELRSFRQQNRLRQTDVARRLGLRETSGLHRLETGKTKRPNREQVLKVAQAINPEDHRAIDHVLRAFGLLPRYAITDESSSQIPRPISESQLSLWLPIGSQNLDEDTFRIFFGQATNLQPYPAMVRYVTDHLLNYLRGVKPGPKVSAFMAASEALLAHAYLNQGRWLQSNGLWESVLRNAVFVREKEVLSPLWHNGNDLWCWAKQMLGVIQRVRKPNNPDAVIDLLDEAEQKANGGNRHPSLVLGNIERDKAKALFVRNPADRRIDSLIQGSLSHLEEAGASGMVAITYDSWAQLFLRQRMPEKALEKVSEGWKRLGEGEPPILRVMLMRSEAEAYIAMKEWATAHHMIEKAKDLCRYGFDDQYRMLLVLEDRFFH